MSPVIPGSTEESLIPILEEASGKKASRDFYVAYNPEFLREGSSIKDYYHPPKIVAGGTDEASIGRALAIYQGIKAPVFKTTINVAEMVKYVDNIFHALKITFANEVGMLCARLAIDSHEVMDIFTQDTKHNISPAYLRPGLPFGGSCLPKDVRMLVQLAGPACLDLPLMRGVR